MSAVTQQDDNTERSRASASPAPELFIVFNPGSGSHDKDEVRQAIESELRAAARAYRFVPVEGGDVRGTCSTAGTLARESGGMVVAVGGDGTINCAAQAAYTHDCVLGVIPQGTFNMFGRDHGLPLDAAEATRALLASQPHPVQVGLVNQALFLVNASLGLYPKLLADREDMKQRLGRKRWVAFISALVTLFEWRLQLTLDAELDGRIARVRTPSLFVCNNRMQLERVGIAEEITRQIGEGRLAGIVSHPLDTWAKLRLMADAILGRLGSAREIDAFTLRSMTVATRHARRARVALDGEVRWMELPLRIAVAPRPLRVLLTPPSTDENSDSSKESSTGT